MFKNINIRKYDPTQASYIRPWGYILYRVLVTTEQYLNNKNVFDQLIDKSYDIAKEEKILKVSKTEHISSQFHICIRNNYC